MAYTYLLADRVNCKIKAKEKLPICLMANNAGDFGSAGEAPHVFNLRPRRRKRYIPPPVHFWIPVPEGW